jgi:DNA-binding transcriptional MerR regulator
MKKEYQMQVTELADTFGVKKDTVRYYTRIGLLRPSKSSNNGYKFYATPEQSRLRFILSARDLGFSIEDIKQIFSESDEGKTPCPTVRVLIEQRLQETEQRFIKMAKLRDRMQSAIKAWDHMPDKAPCSNVICHLIEDFELVQSDTKNSNVQT